LYLVDSISVAVMVTRLTLRSRVAIGAVHLVNTLSRRLGRGRGTVAGGKVGLFIDPHLVAVLAAGRQVIVVSGTNGKTTTSALIAAGWGGEVVHNVTGANMLAGHVAALLASNAPRVVLEVDEAWLDLVVRETHPAVVVLLNLSRDQLDRATEVRALAQRWRAMVEASPQRVYVANASDPLVAYAVERGLTVNYLSVPAVWRDDAQACPKCTQPLDFVSRWNCRCGFAEPPVVGEVTLDGEIRWRGSSVPVVEGLPGLFNRVNAAFALAALDAVGVPALEAAERLGAITVVEGRYGRRQWKGRTLHLLLAKNPAGVAAILRDVAPTGEVWVAINAQVADGRDPSWIYDAPFDLLKGRTVRCFGDRRLDLATRLDTDGVAFEVADEDHPVASGSAEVTLIANYTAFQQWMAVSTPC